MSSPYKALAIKELREIWWIGALAGGAILVIALAMMGWDLDDRPPFVTKHPARGIPFLTEDWPLVVLIVGGIAAAVMALWQTLGESIQGTWGFLLHRPLPRRDLLLGKMLIGCTLLLVCTGIPILIFGLWASTPGTHASPFEWWMAGPTVRAWGYLVVFYLASFLCGLRPARWWVSRFFPVVPVLFPFVILFVFPWIAWPMWLVTILLTALYLSANFYAASVRDYA